MKIFLSYARVDKPICIEIVTTLREHDVWYDDRLYAGQHWWKEILLRLEWCEGFIYLLSAHSVASPYCRKELAIAQRLGRKIIPILIDDKTEIPDALEDMQYVNMSRGLNGRNVALLLNSVLRAERESFSQGNVATLEKVPHIDTLSPIMESAEMIGKAIASLEIGDYDNALLLLRGAESRGFDSRFINLSELIAIAEQGVAEQIRSREAELEYQNIWKIFQESGPSEFVCEVFTAFQEEFPDYDPNNIAKYCDNQVSETQSKQPPWVVTREALPMLHWCKIPSGTVHIANNPNRIGDQAIHVEEFYISQYPVTNKQYQCFIDADDGYDNPRWWQFSDEAFQWFDEHTESLPSRYPEEKRPRENVNWYEAVAFANWLSHCTSSTILLPNLAQWQRAAQGDDGRFYPWGNEFQEDFCNTRESYLRKTTEVNNYDEGVSPYGVYDMAGNVWEWCTDAAPSEDDASEDKRAVIGGSFVSPGVRAQVSFRYYLNPEARFSSIGIRLVCLPNSANINY